MNVDGINIYTKAHVTDASDQVGRIYIGQEELKVRRIGHNAMLEQDAVHIGCEADVAAHVLDVQGRQLSVKGLLDTGAVVSVLPVKTWTDMGFERSDLLPTNIRLAAANQGAILMNVDGINIYTKAQITDANDQIGRIYIGQEELKVRRIGHNAMLEQDAVHISCEADLAAHVLDVQGRQLSVKGLLDTGSVVSVMPVKTWTDMGFERSDLLPTNIRLAAANQGAIYVTGRTPIISLQLGGRHLWMSFLIVENLDESDQFILGRDFVRNFDVTIDLTDGLIRIKDPERKYEKKPLNKILINHAKVPIFLDRKVRLKPNQAVVAKFRMRNLNELSNDRQVCLVSNPNSKSSAILGRSFSLTQSGLCVGVLLNTEATTVTIQREKKLGYALPLNTDFQSVENLKKFVVTKCPLHANQECILKRVNELNSSRKLFSMKSETDDGLSSCSNFPERPTET